MDGVSREMTLDEWVDRLPTCHLARRQLARAKAIEEAARKYIERMDAGGDESLRSCALRDFRAALDMPGGWGVSKGILTSRGSIIGPDHPHDGRQWDCQCARCGSSLAFERCEMCGGDGLDGHDCGEDSCCCMDPEPNLTCDACRGRGSFPQCCSTAEFCKSNPQPGREAIKPSTPEWYVVEDEW